MGGRGGKRGMGSEVAPPPLPSGPPGPHGECVQGVYGGHRHLRRVSARCCRLCPFPFYCPPPLLPPSHSPRAGRGERGHAGARPAPGRESGGTRGRERTGRGRGRGGGGGEAEDEEAAAGGERGRARSALLTLPLPGPSLVIFAPQPLGAEPGPEPAGSTGSEPGRARR